jgi:hypothetical protein
MPITDLIQTAILIGACEDKQKSILFKNNGLFLLRVHKHAAVIRLDTL